MKRSWKKVRVYAASILLALAVAGISGFLTQLGMPVYDQLQKPPLTPSSVVFPIVWTILFVLMGISAGSVYLSESPYRKTALWVYGVQLAMNFIWSVLFFLFQLYFASFLWLVLLWLMILVMILFFRTVNKTAALLQLPYLLWVAFAGYLNLMIWLLN